MGWEKALHRLHCSIHGYQDGVELGSMGGCLLPSMPQVSGQEAHLQRDQMRLWAWANVLLTMYRESPYLL